jgi:hypothetical protein
MKDLSVANFVMGMEIKKRLCKYETLVESKKICLLDYSEGG